MFRQTETKPRTCLSAHGEGFVCLVPAIKIWGCASSVNRKTGSRDKKGGPNKREIDDSRKQDESLEESLGRTPNKTVGA